MPKIVVAQAAQDADQAVILGSLVDFNDSEAGVSHYEKVAVLLCADDTGATLGGLWGKILYDWLYVELLFVPEEYRNKGLGQKLMQAAEVLAVDRSCVGVWLDTYSFQAPGFYQRLGYEVFGQLDDHPRGYTRTFLRKRL